VDNIDFQSTILSRFDLIFIIRDVRDVERDERVARHVMSLHAGGSTAEKVEGEIDLETLRRYVCYARHKCQPRLSDAAARRLQDEYIRIRARYGKPLLVAILSPYLSLSCATPAASAAQSSNVCAPGSTIKQYLCREHKSSNTCAPGSTNTA
jgi:hypothetical protein